MARYSHWARRLVCLTVTLTGASFIAEAGAQTAGSPPDFSSKGVGWDGSDDGFDFFLPIPGEQTPVTTDPKYPYVSNSIARRTGKQSNYHISDVSDPNIKQWAKDIMKKDNDEVLAGKVPFKPAQSCIPWGVPSLAQAGGPFFFVQSPKVVLMMEEGDRFARHIWMNVPHSKNIKPSYYGESVGHYEGDTLVIDTIGISKKAYVDFFRTPHTDQLHVVERWRLIDGGNRLEMHFTVDDPGTFNRPWQGTITLRRNMKYDQGLGEKICQEALLNPHIFEFDIPVAAKPDF